MSTVTLDLHLRCEGEPRSVTLHLPTLPLRPAHGRPMDKVLLGCELEPLKDASTPLRLQVFHARSGEGSFLVWFQGGCVGADGPQEAHCAVALEAIPEELQRELGPQAFPGLDTAFAPCSALTQLEPVFDESGERVVLARRKELGFLRYVELTDAPPMTVDCAIPSENMTSETWEQLVLLILFRYIAGLPTPTLSDLVLLQRRDDEPCIVSTAQAGCAAWDSCPLPWHDQMLGPELWARLLQPGGDLWSVEDIPATVRAWPIAELAVALDPRPSSGGGESAGHTLAEIMVARQVAVENALLESE